ncbi:hypothetical protein AAFF_G00358110 [Aldrovandia affinis]|uniref:Uncharacterized protein n=1 Tax=Aldrovandia affinis TaxID=143900 RepID=A0AAD7T9Z5_9TELE|nr:hypothetical protein AAFF_G00358110 [Aldrovandia affinis]
MKFNTSWTYVVEDQQQTRLKSRHPYNKAAEEMLNFTSEDISRDAWLAAAWKQEWESAGPSRVHRYIWDPGDGAIEETTYHAGNGPR